MQKKNQVTPSSTLKSDASTSGSSSDESGKEVEPLHITMADTKQQINNSLLNKASQDFSTNPLFSASNPNSSKNKQIYIDHLASKGFDKSELQKLNPSTWVDKPYGALQPIHDFVDKIVDNTEGAVVGGLNTVTEGANTLVGALGGQTGSIGEKTHDITKGGLQVVTGAGGAALGAASVAVPELAAFTVGSEAIKETANKNLSKEHAETVNKVMDIPFSAVTSTAHALGINPEKDSNWNMLMQIGDFAAVAYGMKVYGDAKNTIKSIKDLKEMSAKAANNELPPEEAKKYQEFADKTVDLNDIKKAAEQSDTPQAKEVVAKINSIPEPQPEVKLPPELDRLTKAKNQWINIMPSLTSEAAKADVQAKIEETNTAIAKEVDNHTSEPHQSANNEVAGNVISTDLEKATNDLKAAKENKLPEVAKVIEGTIEKLNTVNESLKQKKNTTFDTENKTNSDGSKESRSISQGNNGEIPEGNSRNEEIPSELQRRIGEAQQNAGNSEADGRGIPKDQREVDNKVAYNLAKETGTWINDMSSLGEEFTSGNENTNFFNAKEQKVYKSNNLMNTLSLNKFLEKIKIHNELFPNTAYKFEGFTGIKDTGKGKSYVEPVYSQDFIKNAENATPKEISDYMENRGFEKSGDFTFKKGDTEVSDLRPRNVIKDKSGNIYVIDAEFKKHQKEPAEAPPEVKVEKAVLLKDIKGKKVIDSRDGKEGVITSIRKPLKGAANEKEPFIVDVKWNNGKKSINFPVGDIIKFKEETKSEEVKVEKESKKEVKEKISELKEESGSALLVKQKQKLSEDLHSVEDIVLGEDGAKRKQEIIDNENLSKEDKLKAIQQLYNISDDVAIADAKQRLEDAGYKVKDGKVRVKIYKDGEVNIGSIRTAIETVEKEYPTSEKKGPSAIKREGTMPKQKAIGNYETLADAEQSKADALSNLETAKKSGNKAQIDLYQKQAELESDAYKNVKQLHKNVINEIVSTEKNIKENKINSKYDIERLLNLPKLKESVAAFEGKEVSKETPDYQLAKTHLERLLKESESEHEESLKPFLKKDGTLKSNIGKGGEARLSRETNEIAELKTDLESVNKKIEAPTPKAKAKQNLADKKKAFIDKSKGSMSSGGLQAIPEFVELVKAYVEYGLVTAKDFVAKFKEDFPGDKFTDEELSKAFDEINKKSEPAPKDILGEIKSEEGTTKLRHEDSDKIRQELGMETRNPTERKSSEELNNQADELIKKGYDFPKLIDEIEKGKVPTDVERTVLTKYYGALRAKVESMDLTSPEFNKTIAEGERVLRASEVAGTAAGRALQSIQNFSINDESLLSYLVREKEINMGGELTEKQRLQVQKEYNELKEAKEKVDANYLRLQAENTALKAKRNLKVVTEELRGNIKKSHSERVIERKGYVNTAKEKLAKLRASSNVVIVPYANELIAISPEVGKFVRSLAAEGIDNLGEVVKAVHKEFKELVPDLTDSDVNNIIAGEYNVKKQTRTEISIQLADLRSEAKLVAKLDELNRGVEPKTERKLRERNQQIAELQKQVKENDLTKLAARRVRLKTSIARLEKSLATGDFLKVEPKKQPIKLDAAASADLNKLIKLKNEREIRIIQDQYANRTKFQKTKDTGLELLNAPRTIMASMDFSAPLRQGLVPTITHPTIAGKAFIEMFKQSVSQGRFDRWFHELRQSDEYVTMEQSKLYVADPHNPKLSAKEEQFMNNLAEKIPFVGKLIKGSERAYVSYLNKMRVDLFQQGVDVLEQQGKTFANSPEDYKGLASWVNNSTGRGKIGVLETAAPVLNSVLFSPRLLASRINLMNPVYYAKLPKEVRISALKDITKFVGFGLSVLAIAKLAGADVENDPRSSDFAKIKIDDTRYDIWGGFQQYVRFFSQIITGQSKSTNTGKLEDLSGSGLFGATRATILGRFLRGKLAPIPAISLDFLSGRKATGEPTTVSGEIEGGLTPLIYQDIKSMIQLKKDPALIFTTSLLATFGVGTNTYQSKSKKQTIVAHD